MTIEKYNKDGYLIVKSLINNDTIDKIVDEIYEKQPDNKNLSRITDAWKTHDIIGYLAFNKKIINILTHLYDRKPVPFQTLNFYLGTEQKIHSDQIHFCSDPLNLMCGVWIALEDVSIDSGPLVYYPGSHKLPFYSMQRLKIEPGNYSEYEKKIQQKIDEIGIKPEYGVIKKGDVIIWQANLLHGGSKRNDNNLTRKSIVIHYFFEKCKYWTPMLSGPSNIIYRNPSDFVDNKFSSKNSPDKTNDKMNVQKYKNSYSDLHNLSDEQAIEHYHKHGIYENRKFYSLHKI
jgi:ectoine hydroxylase-related dioxygenase (phytanoyl-CoA dioxygenase family)